MDRLLMTLFHGTDQHPDPVEWGKVFGSHFGFAILAWVVYMIWQGDAWMATKVTIFLYSVWEVIQFSFRRTKLAFLDSAVDIVSWASVSFALFEIYNHQMINALIYAGGATLALMIGVCKRVRCNAGH